MQVEYTGRQVAITRALRNQAEAGIERIAKILVGKITSAHVILSATKYRQTAEVTIKTRLSKIVGFAECPNMETSLRDALSKAETQAIRARKKLQAKKRQPKEEKDTAEPQLARPRRPAKSVTANGGEAGAPPSRNGNSRGKAVVPVTVHSFPARTPVHEPHVTHSTDSVALRPMTLEEAVKEAEFRDRDVFVFRDNNGGVKVLHRKRDGKMELIEAP
ncbi:MAG TPA: ribosome-associated translation inhibitor RaiA [Acidobacteriaceae bacterium]|nr:ribosome-associated translation inhibitor RaiA [Acidobacteriaceae bacterium]